MTSPYPHLKQYLFSLSMPQSPDASVQLVPKDSVSLVQELKKQPGKDIWLCGGGELAATLFPEINEMILKVNPILLGSGIPLFAGTVKQTDLELAGSRVYNNGFMLLRYRLRRC